jgi:hypothetical protein
MSVETAKLDEDLMTVKISNDGVEISIGDKMVQLGFGNAVLLTNYLNEYKYFFTRRKDDLV